MGDLIITLLLFIVGFSSLVGCKYIMYRCKLNDIDNTIFIEESIDDVPPKYEDIT